MKNKMKEFSIQKGFTLIELLIVIVIIGVLSSFLVTNYVGVRMRARDTQRKSDLRQIQSALEIYRSDVGAYPAALPACNAALQSPPPPPLVTYMQKRPCDPTNSGQLIYRYRRAASSNVLYTLAACLENVNDQQGDSVNNPAQVNGDPSITFCVPASNRSYTLYSP